MKITEKFILWLSILTLMILNSSLKIIAMLNRNQHLLQTNELIKTDTRIMKLNLMLQVTQYLTCKEVETITETWQLLINEDKKENWVEEERLKSRLKTRLKRKTSIWSKKWMNRMTLISKLLLKLKETQMMIFTNQKPWDEKRNRTAEKSMIKVLSLITRTWKRKF